MLLFIIILTQGVLFLYLLSHMYCNSIIDIKKEEKEVILLIHPMLSSAKGNEGGNSR